ncbi:MAG TPA: molybdenum cofactor guanylyltransferase [Terracidiphilus sp.]|nr:molybdenum cofactor guanylyltransferase [Terracidiphilus sp.]
MPVLHQPAAAGFVLAGGQSSRMGRDKALLPLAGQPLIARALANLCDAGLSAAIAGARSNLAQFAPLVEDANPGLGPLSGVCAALASTSAHHSVFLPVDLPFLPASLLCYLLHQARITGRAITVPTINGFAQTFPAVLDRAILPLLQAELAAGRLGCFAAFRSAAAAIGQPVSSVAVELLVHAGHVEHPAGLPPAHWFLNLNTPSDLERAEREMTSRFA